MSLVSVIPGRNFSTTLQLPQNASGPVSWSVRDNTGKILLKGQCAPAGTTVVISGVLPSNTKVPPDGSKFSILATDGITSTSEYFDVIAPDDLAVQHGIEIAYVVKHPFRDSLILPKRADEVSVKIALSDGAWPIGAATPYKICDEPYRRGDSWVYTFNYAKTPQGAGANPPGSLDTHVMQSLGTGMVIWDYTLCDDVDSGQQIHPIYTITAHSMTFLNGIRKLVDKARIGDVNTYLEYTMSDLAHAFARGCEFVWQSPPAAGGWPIDQTPVALKDYIIKAAAVDILRAQYMAEGMSQFDLQGLRTTLSVDRTQYLAQLVGELEQDLQGLPAAKNMWMAQGSPMGNQLGSGRRPIGILGLTRGVYSNFPLHPLPITGGGYTFLGNGMGFGPMF